MRRENQFPAPFAEGVGASTLGLGVTGRGVVSVGGVERSIPISLSAASRRWRSRRSSSSSSCGSSLRAATATTGDGVLFGGLVLLDELAGAALDARRRGFSWGLTGSAGAAPKPSERKSIENPRRA